MKTVKLFLVAVATVALASCGGGESASTTTDSATVVADTTPVVADTVAVKADSASVVADTVKK